LTRFACLRLATAVLIGVIWSGTGWGAPSTQCIRIGIDPGAVAARLAGLILHALYDEAGLCLELSELPNHRIMMMLARHQLDGIAVGTIDALDGADHLIAIPTPLATLKTMLFWPKDRPQPSGTEARIGSLRGSSWPLLAAEQRGLRIVEIADQSSLTKMALSHRIDGFFMTDYEFHKFFPGNSGDFESQQVGRVSFHHILTSDHQALVWQLDEALTRLQTSGKFKDLAAQIEPH
jgi:hypothetical protein